MNITDKLAEIETRFAGTYKKELLDIWMYLHQQERPDPILQVKLLHPDAKVPTRGSEGAIGWDIYAKDKEHICIHSAPTIISTGVSVAIPQGYYGRIAPRSGLAAKYGVDVLAGVVDSDYRGEVKVILISHAGVQYIDPGYPIAQLILERADQGRLMVVDELQDTARGAGGFGSTDKLTNFCTTCAAVGITNFDVLVSNTRFGNLCANCYEVHK